MTQFTMERILKAAGPFNRLTKLFEQQRSAFVFDIFSYTIITYTWLWKDYGTGLLQADEALFVAGIIVSNTVHV